jgi:hypothetical protein
MCDLKVSLFDELLTELTYDLEIRDPSIQSNEMVTYTSNRTNGKAVMSFARYLAITSLRPGLIKRFIGNTVATTTLSESDRHTAAVNEFLEDNARCEAFNSSFHLTSLGEFSQCVIGEAAELLARSLDGFHGSRLTFSAVSSKLRTGPGSSSDIPKKFFDNSMYAKVCEGVMTFTSTTVRKLYKACTLATRITYAAEAVRQYMYGDGDSVDTLAIFRSVPKTNAKNRGICTQPSGNMLAQLATHDILRVALNDDFGVDLAAQQDFNRTLACIGSTGKTSFENDSYEFCTVDLSRASNFLKSSIPFCRSSSRWGG